MNMIVEFKHCNTCKHLNKEEHEEPCTDCLCDAVNQDSRRPTYYERDPKIKEKANELKKSSRNNRRKRH